ncbi:MAG: hypothetical protein QW179_03495 [Candidatus Hadarchaeales archaeon]
MRRAYLCARCRYRGMNGVCPAAPQFPNHSSWAGFLADRMKCIEGQLDWTEEDRAEAIRELRENARRHEKI